MPVAILIGLVGAFIGDVVGTTFSPDMAAAVNTYASSTAAIGAMILLFQNWSWPILPRLFTNNAAAAETRLISGPLWDHDHAGGFFNPSTALFAIATVADRKCGVSSDQASVTVANWGSIAALSAAPLVKTVAFSVGFAVCSRPASPTCNNPAKTSA